MTEVTHNSEYTDPAVDELHDEQVGTIFNSFKRSATALCAGCARCSCTVRNALNSKVEAGVENQACTRLRAAPAAACPALRCVLSPQDLSGFDPETGEPLPSSQYEEYYDEETGEYVRRKKKKKKKRRHRERLPEEIAEVCPMMRVRHTPCYAATLGATLLPLHKFVRVHAARGMICNASGTTHGCGVEPCHLGHDQLCGHMLAGL